MAEEAPLTWIEIDDFTPGIITNSQLAYSPNGSNGNTGPVPGNKVGQAQAAVGCIALPNGGLGPLPALSSSPIAPLNSPQGSPYLTIINGLFSVGPYYSGGYPQMGDLLLYGYFEFDASNNNADFYLVEAPVVPTATTTQINVAIISGTGIPAFTMMTGDTTSANSGGTGVGNPTCAMGLWWIYTPGASPESYVWLYPHPTSPGNTGAYVLVSGTGPSSDVICHQNRIICLSNLVVNAGVTGGTVNTNASELFNYTEPPNSLVLGTQQETFVQEHPFGVGAWGSINASELFLVKHNGGGYFIDGDLNNPTVIRLPGVTSTYGLMSRGGDTPLGYVYASNNRGLWVWGGGSTSSKISEQLDDNFFVNPYLPTIAQGGVAHGWTVDVRGWGDWIVVTNDWVMDTNLGGWWKLQPSSTGQPHLYYAVSSDGNTLFASVPQPSAATGIDKYSRLTPTSSFTWTSYPMRLGQGSKDRQYSIRSVVVRAQGNGTVGIVLTGFEGTTSQNTSSPSHTLTFEATSDSSQPRMQMISTGLAAQDITVEIFSAGKTTSYPAPVVYSVAIGYVEQQPVSSS